MIVRRAFTKALVSLLLAALCDGDEVRAETLQNQYAVEQNCVVECKYQSAKERSDPFNTVELDAIITDAEGREQRVPAFWAGGR